MRSYEAWCLLKPGPDLYSQKKAASTLGEENIGLDGLWMEPGPSFCPCSRSFYYNTTARSRSWMLRMCKSKVVTETFGFKLSPFSPTASIFSRRNDKTKTYR